MVFRAGGTRVNVEEYNAQIAAGMTEAVLQQRVMAIAAALGWTLRYHTFDSRRSNRGFPDCVFVRGERIVFAELKSQKGRLRPEQREWLAGLEATPAETHVWRPADLLGGVVEDALR